MAETSGVACAMLNGMSLRVGNGPDSAVESIVLPSASLLACCVLIPAWQPNATLGTLISHLSRRGFGKLLVIDDGSTSVHQTVFAEIANLPGVEVQRHAANLGKGRALKTGFQHLLNTQPDLLGVITADADGQHMPDDIEKVARALLSTLPRPVLGSRGFEQNVPWRSRLGNTLTRWLFGRLTGVRLSDTQTGLRGFPLASLPELLALPGDRYEYEMTALAHLCRTGRTPVEIPIRTVYLDNNRHSHFRPVWDSMRIYAALLRLSARRRP